MKILKKKEHRMDTVFTLLLFAVYLLVLLFLLLFSAGVYRASRQQVNYGFGLSTARSYLTEKVHHYDRTEGISLGELNGIPALCLKEELEAQPYVTYIYLEDHHLKELFTRENSSASPAMGTPIAELSSIEYSLTEDGFLQILLTDADGHKEELLLHLRCYSPN